MIELQHVSAGYGAQDVVRDVSFAAPNGQLTALIGPNGSGKTTLLRAMTRTLPCRSGWDSLLSLLLLGCWTLLRTGWRRLTAK